MKKNSGETVREPVGRIMANISRMFLADLQRNLDHLDIHRSFYPLLLIEAGAGELTQNELAGKLSCSKVQVVRIIDYLSSHGYVTRRERKDDRRKYSLVVTGKAKEVIPDIREAIRETTLLATGGIPHQKADELYDLLRIIEKNLSKNNAL